MNGSYRGLGLGLTLLALLAAPAVAERFHLRGEARVVCGGMPLTVAGDGMKEFLWFAGDKADEVEVDGDSLKVKGAPLTPIFRGTTPELDSSRAVGHKFLYVLMRSATGAVEVARLDITAGKPVEPVIVANPEGDVERGSPLELSTKAKYEEYEWTLLGFEMRPEKVKRRARREGKLAVQELNVSATDDQKNVWAALEEAHIRCWKKGDGGRLERCTGNPWDLMSGPRSTDRRWVRTHYWRVDTHQSLGKAEKVVDHPLYGTTLYSVEVKDKNSCRGVEFFQAAVDQHRLELIAGLDYATLSSSEESATEEVVTTKEAMDGDADGTAPQDSKLGDLFGNGTGFVGVQAQQYVRRWLGVYSQVRFGGTNIDPAKASDLTKSLTQADTVIADIGVFFDGLCGPSHQTCFYGKLEWGFIFPESGDLVEGDDVLERSFSGIGWRYHKPGHMFHRSFTEVGYGRSDNFARNTGRVKLRARANFDISGTWDTFFDVQLDHDRGDGPDDLRVLLGVSRDMGFVGETLAKLLGFSEKAKK